MGIFARTLGFCILGLLPLLSIAQSPSPDVVRGRDWLVSQVQADGSLRSVGQSLATTTQAETEVYETLKLLGVSPPGLAQRVAAAVPDESVEHSARLLLARALQSTQIETALDRLRGMQNADGGFGGSRGYGSDTLDTALAVVALRAAGDRNSNGLARAVTFLAERLVDLDTLALHAGDGARPYRAAYQLLALQMASPHFPIAAAVESARNQLLALQGAGSHSETLNNAIAAIALSYTSAGGTGLDSLRSALRASQAADGSWSQDPYLTALALRGLQGNVVTPPPSTGRITATIRELPNLAPLAGATFALSGPSPLSLSSASDGSISAAEVLPGSYTILVSKPGFVPKNLTGANVTAGQVLSLGNIDLARATNVAVLRGTVTDVRDGLPIAGATIDVSGVLNATVMTGPDGRYELQAAQPGSVTVQVSKTGFQPALGSGALTLGQITQFSPALYPNGMVPPDQAVLTGTVVSAADNRPIAGASVSIGGAQVQSGSDGAIRLVGLPVGSFEGSVAATGFQSLSLSGTLSAGVNNVGLIRMAPLQNTQESTVVGRVTDASNGTPVAGAIIEVVGSNLRAQSSASGEYQIAGIMTVPFALRATASGYQSVTLTHSASSHGTYTVDIPLTRLSGGSFVLDGLTISSPEIDPYTEVGVLGVVRNTGSSEDGLIFNAVVYDAAQLVVRDVPAVVIGAHMQPTEAILPIAAGQSRTVRITWGVQSDPPGTYSVRFRGMAPNGQIAVEGSVSYSIRAVRRLGGAVTATPPLLQAGLGQSVSLTARLGNLGNLPITAGNAELTATLVNADNRPPYPAEPTLGSPSPVGAPLDRPYDGAVGPDGRVYLVNRNSRQLLRIEPDGTATVLRVLDNGNGSMGTPERIAMHPDGRLRVSWTGRFLSTVVLDAPYTQSNEARPFDSAKAFEIDAEGNFYFGGTHQTRAQIVKRAPGGLVSVLADAGFGNARESVVGPDQAIYLANSSIGTVYRVDATTARVTPYLTGLSNPTGLLFEPGGDLLIAEETSNRIRRYSNGVLTTWASLNRPAYLRRGRDGKVYSLSSADGTLYRHEADGSASVYARGLVRDGRAVRLDSAGRLYALTPTELRRRNADGSTVTLVSNLNGAHDLVFDATDVPIVAETRAIKRIVGGSASTLYSSPFSVQIEALAMKAGELHFATTEGSSANLYRLDGGTPVLLDASPSNVFGVAFLGSTMVLSNGTRWFALQPTGRMTRLGEEHVSSQSWPSSRAGLYSYTNSGLISQQGLHAIGAGGERTRVTAALANLSGRGTVDSQGRVIYGRIDRSIARMTPATATIEVLGTLSGSENILAVVTDAADRVFVHTSMQRLYRLDGTSTVLVATAQDVVPASNAAPWWRLGQAYFTLNAGDQVEQRYTTAEAPTAWAVDGAGQVLAYRSGPQRIELRNATGQVQLDRPLYTAAESIAVLGDDLYVAGSSRLHRFPPDGNVTRIAGEQSGVTAVSSAAGKLYVSTPQGIFERQGNTLLPYWTTTSWVAGDYREFDIRGTRLAALNAANNEVVLTDAGQQIASYAPIWNASSFAPMPQGDWLVSVANRLIQISADGGTSRVRASSFYAAELEADANHAYALSSDGILTRINADETYTNIAAPEARLTFQAVSLAVSGGGMYQVTGAGQLLRRDAAFFRHFASGVEGPADLALDSNGRVYVADDRADALGVIDANGYRQVASGFGTPVSVSVQSDDAILVGTADALVISDSGGRWSRRLWPPSTNPRAILRRSSTSAWVVDYQTSRIIPATITDPPPGVAVGTVVYRQTRPHGALGTQGAESIDYGSFVPPVGGDYEIRVRSTDPGIAGLAATGLHVGPQANARITVSPERVVPQQAQVRVRTRIEGANFSSLSRIDTTQLQVVLPQSFYPDAMGTDASGAIWYVLGRILYRGSPGGAGIRIGNDLVMQRGEVPVDQQQRAYIVTPGSFSTSTIKRLTSSGQSSTLATVPGSVQSLTIDEQDRIYALVSGRIVRVLPDGSQSEYAALPAGTPFGLTRDGMGNLYAQMFGNVVYRIDPSRQVSTVLSDSTFEYEGVNIAGTCAEGLFFTPFRYDRVGQDGEEYTVAQVLGSTGQIGAIFNGRTAPELMTDIDFIVYDRFASKLMMVSETPLPVRMFTMPVTCGAIDVSLHIVLPAGQAYTGVSPAPTQTIVRSNGDSELIFELRDVNRQGVEIGFDTLLTQLARGESRAVAKEAALVFRNTFAPAPVRLPLEVPRVQVEDLIDISVSTDRPSYPQNTAVNIDLWLRNEQVLSGSGRLVVAIEDANGAVVETLIDRPERLDGGEVRELDPPFTTGSRRAGNYQVAARILAGEGTVLAQDLAPFTITAGNGTASLNSTVATDRAQYPPSGTVIISAQISNPNLNQGFSELSVRETVMRPDGSTLQTLTRAIPNLDPGAQLRVEFELALSNAPSGRYEVRQQVTDRTGTVLSAPSTSFEVQSQQGNDALTGTLTVTPAQVPRPQTAQFSASVSNRGSVAMAGVPLVLRILNPAQGNAEIRRFEYTRDLAAGASTSLEQAWSTEGIAPGAYIALLVSRLAGADRVLDQKPVTVLASVVSGEIAANPTDATSTQAVALSATARNTGNLAATDLPFSLRVIRVAGGAVVREFSYTASLPPQGQISRSEMLAAGSLPLGEYRAEWAVTVGGSVQPLAQASFRVLGAEIGGSLDASPAVLPLGQVVQLSASVRNTGNAPSNTLPLRLEIRRVDTQVLMQTWDDSTSLPAGASFSMQRQWTAAIAARYVATLSAQLAGGWQTLASANFEVSAPSVDVRMSMQVERDARVLVMASCSPGQGRALDGNGDAIATPSNCESTKKSFLEQYLRQIAVEHKVVLTRDEFMREFRCGRYNVHWLSGGSEKLAVADSKELREAIYRGEGLIIDGSHDQRTAMLDEIAGFRFRGRHAQENQVLRGLGVLLPAVDVNTYGSALHLETSGGQVQASLVAGASPGVISHTYGQGRTMTYAFDLVEALRRDATLPATQRLLDAALFHVAPTVVAPSHPAGGYVPVTTTVENRAAAVDLNLRSEVPAPASVESSAPTPTSSDPRSATWDFALAGGQTRSFDVGVRLPTATDSSLRSILQRRNGPLLEALSNQTANLPLLQTGPTSQALLVELNAANLTGGEAQARNRAVSAIQAALSAHNGNDAPGAVAKWIDAAEEIMRINSVPHASWRLANARLLEASQRAACNAPLNSCDVLGVAGQYNGFFFGSYSAQSSDVQGRLAAGGNVSLNNYSIGDQLPSNFSGPSLLVGGNLSFPSGRVYRGDIVVGGSAAGVGAPVINGLGPNQRLLQNAAMPLDFAAERSRLIAESQRLRGFAANTTHEYQWGGLYLHGDNSSALQVFNLNGQQVLDAHTFQVDRIPAGATVLFNVSGSATGLTNMSLSSLIPHRNKVLFNFYEATTLELAGVSVEGSVLAPLASINNPQGVIWGTIVAQQWNGQMQVNLAPHSGCMQAPAAPPSLCVTTPAIPVKVGAGQAQFTAFNALERLEVRGGRPGASDWEWGLGANTQAAGQFVTEHLDWVNGKSYRYVLRYDGQGNGTLQVFDGSNQLFSKTYTGTPGRLLRAGNAVELYVKSSAGIGTARLIATLARLESGTYSELLATATNNSASEARLVLFAPSLGDGFEAEGTVKFEFNGASPPSGSRLNFFITAGNLSCAGGSP